MKPSAPWRRNRPKLDDNAIAARIRQVRTLLVPNSKQLAKTAAQVGARLGAQLVSFWHMLCALGTKAALIIRRGENRYPNRREQLRQVRRSVGVSMRNNLPLTVAGILTASVALSLVGAALTVSAGVDNATIRWKGGVETIVFMNPQATGEIIDAVGADLAAEPVVRRAEFVSQQAAYEEFKVMFRTSPELVRSVGPDALPASWRVVPADSATVEQIDELGQRYQQRNGVYQVVYARDAVQSVLGVSEAVQWALGLLALTLGAAAWLLTIASCRAAAWARRDELAVMRLVGAPRWVVRLPFVIEGALQGALGSALAGAATWKVADVIEARVADGDSLAILRAFSVDADTRWQIIGLLVTLGAGFGAIGAMIAIGRYAKAREGLPSNMVLRWVKLVRLAASRRRHDRHGHTLQPASITTTTAGKVPPSGPVRPVATEKVAAGAFQDSPPEL